jgi:plastocyanin
MGAALVAALSTVGLAAAARPQPTTAVGVSAREFHFGLYRTSVPRGTVRFNLTNFGEDRHDLVVLTRDGRELGRSAEVRAGERTTLRLRLAPGTYKLRCDVADHARRGMRTSIQVTRPRTRRR